MDESELIFDGENPNEKVLFVLHRHSWVLLRTGLWVVGLLLVLTLLFRIFGASQVTSIALFVLLPIILYIAFRSWFLWTNSVYVLTNDRLLAVQQQGWFSRNVKEVALEMIMTVSHDVRGPVATVFNFGEIIIQASGASEKDMTLEYIYDPYEVQQRISRAQRERNSKRQTRQAD